MHPVLFKIMFIEARSYYVLWAFALLIFILWTRSRAVKRFAISWDDATSVILWVYTGAILGALTGTAAERIPLYLSGALSLSDVFKGGLSALPGMLFGGLFGIYRLKKLGISIDKFADSASLPASALIAAGRPGCFLEGCCLGEGFYLNDAPMWLVHFPFDPPSFFRCPTQLMESLLGFLLLSILFTLEKYMDKTGKKFRGAVLFPIFLMSYGSFRIIFDGMRESSADSAFSSGLILAYVQLVFGLLWLFKTLKYGSDIK